ncbi:MAG TPA: glycosyltransferase family 4 protein [Chryseosolibacter sp.]
MKMLVLLNSLRVSGTEQLMTQVSAILSQRGHQVALFPLVTPFDDCYVEQLKANGVYDLVFFPRWVTSFDKLIWKANAFFVRTFGYALREKILLRWLKNFCTRNKVQLIISNSHTTDSFILPLINESLKLVIIEHGSYVDKILNGLPFDERPLQKAECVIGVSRWTSSVLQARFNSKGVRTIYNGHVVNRNGKMSERLKYWLKSSQAPVFAMHGRGAEQKGWSIAFEAIELVRQKGFDVRFLVMSEGEFIDKLAFQHRGDHIFVNGFSYNLPEIIEHVFAGLLPSIGFETFGLSALDYMAMGKPVLASMVGGLPELVMHNGQPGGVILPVKEGGRLDPMTLAEAMIKLLTDTNYYQALATSAKTISASYTMERCADQYEQTLSELIS